MKRIFSSLSNRIKSLFSWISIEQERDDTFFHPETVIFENFFQRTGVWWGKKNLGKIVLLSLFFLTCAVLYALTLKGVAGNPDPKAMKSMDRSSYPFELSPERGRYAHTYALAVNHSFSLNKELADVVYPDVGYVDGRFYSFFAPGISILAVPFYLLGAYFNLAQVFSFGIISLFALGNLFFLYRIGRDIFKLGTPLSLVAPLIFAFGSTSWSYATTMYQHHLTTFFIISSFYAVWRFSKRSRLSIVWGAYVWFCYAAAFMVDYPNLLFMFPIMLYFFLSSVSWTKLKQTLSVSVRPAFLFTCIFFVILSALHAYYNYTQFGDWKKLSGNIVGYKLIRERQLLEKANGKEVIKEIADDKTTASFFAEENIVRGLDTLLIAPDKGIFFFSPIFLLGIAGIATLLKKIDKERGILLSLVVINTFLYASFGDPWGGWAFGPRYLILSMSVLSLFIALWLNQVKQQILAKAVLFILFAYSAAISLVGVLTTNAVPPKVEADFIKSKFGYFLNLDYMKDSISSSYVYNTYLYNHLSLIQYFAVIYVIVLALFMLILILVRKEKTIPHEN